MLGYRRMATWYRCPHQTDRNGYKKTAFVPLPNKHLSALHAWASRCGLCHAIIIQQLVAVEGKLGLRWKLLRYWPKCEIAESLYKG